MEIQPVAEPARPPPRRGSVAKVIAVAVVLIVLVVVLASPWFWGFIDRLGRPARSYDGAAEIYVTRAIDLTTSGPGTVDYEIDIPLPMSISDANGAYVQQMRKVDPYPTPLQDFKYGDNWMIWEDAGVDSFNITIDYQFSTRTVWWDIDSESSADIDAVPQDLVDRFCTREWKIDPTEDEVAALALDLTRMEDNVHDKLRAIFDHMVENFDYATSSVGEPKDCLQTLQDRNGDCDDQSILFCSLARAAGIPAWLEFGILYDPGTGSFGGHAWVKTYVPTTDGHGGAVNIDVVNGEFLLRGCNRISEWEADGNGTHLEDYYNSLMYSAPVNVQVSFGEEYDGSYAPSGEKVVVEEGGRPSTPGVEVAVAVAVVSILAISRRRPQRAR
jgi:transglutaminase-like putative cysteine protease